MQIHTFYAIQLTDTRNNLYYLDSNYQWRALYAAHFMLSLESAKVMYEKVIGFMITDNKSFKIVKVKMRICNDL